MKNNTLFTGNPSAAGHSDRRQRRSREAILSAFTDLLSEKPYAGITVGDIIDRADVGRSTFYAHFETKDDLLRALCNRLFDHVLFRAHRSPESRSSTDAKPDDLDPFAHMMGHLRDRNGELLKLLSLQEDSLFTSYFKQRMREIIGEWIRDRSVSLPEGTPADYVADHIACSFVDTVLWWAKNRPDLSPDEVTRYFHSVISPLSEKSLF